MRDHAPGLELAFPDRFAEASYRVEEISGRLPEWLRGTYYLNGPALFRRGQLRYRHWLDGDGMICALRFDGDGVWLTNRYVQGKKHATEERAGAALYRTFGTAFDNDSLERGIALVSPVNVSVYRWGPLLLACGEQGLPYRLDPLTLETLEPFDFGGRLNEVSPLAAHAHLDPESDELVTFGVSFSPRQPMLHLYSARLADDALASFRRSRIALDWPASIHDFALSKRHAVFYVSPYRLDMEILRRGGAVLEALHWEPDGSLGPSQLLVVARESGEVAARVELGSAYCLHLVNAFEEDASERDSLLQVDLIEYPEPLYPHYQPLPELFREAPTGTAVRYSLDLDGAGWKARSEIAYCGSPDFPTIDPQHVTCAYRDVWMLGMSAAGESGRKYFDQLVHARWDRPERCAIYTSEPGTYLGGEPAVAVHPEDPRAAVVICPLFDARRRQSSVLVFDALDVEAGPRAALTLKEPIALGFHAQFASRS